MLISNEKNRLRPRRLLRLLHHQHGQAGRRFLVGSVDHQHCRPEGGGEIVEFVIILGSKNAVKAFHRTQVNVGRGLSVAVEIYGREVNQSWRYQR